MYVGVDLQPVGTTMLTLYNFVGLNCFTPCFSMAELTPELEDMWLL